MPFYIRKSVSAGPFRFNLSGSGIGLSVGIKGLRIGTGPRGHYVHAGRGGLYCRASIGGQQLRSAASGYTARTPNAPPPVARPTANGRVIMVEVSSGDVLAMRDSSVSELIDDLNAKQAQLPLGPTLSASAAILSLLVILATGEPSAVAGGLWAVALLPALLAWILGEWLDGSFRTSVLFYNLDASSTAGYQRVTHEFDILASCQGKWHILSGGSVQDITTWKRNAGADHLIDRKAAEFTYRIPKVLRSNVTPPTIRLAGRTFYFFPEVIIVQSSGKFGAVSYGDLAIRWQQSRFIEDGNQPADANVVDQTWKYPNKTGGPDRRFRSNWRLPICLYEIMHISSNSGVNELVQFSKLGVVQPFALALHDLPRKPASLSLRTIAPNHP
jgi:Protein of unknown function (DUF4236)